MLVQVCFYMCPYGRFQSVMTDEESLLVTYEAWRGEPRMKGAKDLDSPDRGHCVDCALCVQACPTGIDIREGQQMECIGCGLCIDACNTMMDNLNLPRNLISYDSYTNMIAREKGLGKQVHLIRPRTIYYAVILTAVLAVIMTSLSFRDRLEINIQRDRAPLFVTLSDGAIRNGYTYKILNMESSQKEYELSVSGIEGATMTVIGQDDKDQEVVNLTVKADHVGAFKIFMRAETKYLAGPSTNIDFVLKDKETGEITTQTTVFRGP